MNSIMRNFNVADHATSHQADAKTYLKYLTQALMRSMHPLLNLNTEDEAFNDLDLEAMEAFLQPPDEPEARQAWLTRVKERANLGYESSRLTAFFRLFHGIRTKVLPGRKIVVFSRSLKFLDIIEEAIFRLWSIGSLRYDGTVNASQRKRIQQRFADRDTWFPLLITAGAGGVGLNIQAASVIIQTKP